MLVIWLCTIAASIVAIAYFRNVFRKNWVMKLKSLPSVDDSEIVSMINILTDSLLVDGQIDDFWIEPSDIQLARLQASQSAQRTIKFETFLFNPGRKAGDFATALIEKVREGVDIYYIFDYFWSKIFPRLYSYEFRRES